MECCHNVCCWICIHLHQFFENTPSGIYCQCKNNNHLFHHHFYYCFCLHRQACEYFSDCRRIKWLHPPFLSWIDALGDDEKEIATLSASTMVVMEWMDNRSCYALDECGYFYKRDPEIILMCALFLKPSTSMLLLKDQQFQRQ